MNKVEQKSGRERRVASVPRRQENRLDIRVPDYYVLRLVARSLLALVLISFTALSISPRSVFSTATAMAAATNGVLSRQEDGVSFLPTLFCDLNRRGLLRAGDQALFLSQHSGSALKRLIKQNKMILVASCSSRCHSRQFQSSIPDSALDFVFSSNGISDIEFIDRVLKIGGITVIRLSSKQVVPYRAISNFRIVYIRKFHLTMVAMKKEFDRSRQTISPLLRQRRLLALPEKSKEEALNMLEDVLLEPPRSSLSGRKSQESYLKRLKFLPDLTGDSLHGYSKRIFIEVVSKSSSIRRKDDRSTAKWFLNNYPTRKLPFEILRLELQEEEDAAEEESEISAWLRSNVRDDEFVVMKADAAAVEAMVRSGAASLVDELFLDCGNGWEKTGRTRRPYWEYLSLYGKLLDSGVAVHQWWWS